MARALLTMGRSFWMIQQDTFWSESLSSVSIRDSPSDIIFDRASEHGPLVAGLFPLFPSLILSGGYYGAKPTSSSKKYFDRLSDDISWWYVPDNAYMTSLCQLAGLAECGHLPFRYWFPIKKKIHFSLITNWQWLDSSSGGTPPKFIQFDGETKLGGKLTQVGARGPSKPLQMKKLSFYFLADDGRTCNSDAVEVG